MAPIDRHSVLRGEPAVRPHVLLVASRRLKSQRRRYAAKDLRRQCATKPNQHWLLAVASPCRGSPRKGSDRNLRRHAHCGGERCFDCTDAAAQPANGAGQGDIRSAQSVSCGLNAFDRAYHSDAVLNGDKQARQSGREKIGKQAESLPALRAIPSCDAQSSGRCAPIAAMTDKGTTARRVRRAAG